MPINVGFIGTGIIAHRHKANLAALPDVELTACADVDMRRAEEFAASNAAKAYGDYRTMLDREKLDAVFLCTPHTVRLEPIRLIAERKVPLFCEKPPEFTMPEANEAARHINAAGVLNTVGFMYRWLRIAEKAKELLAGKKVSVCQITGCWSVLYWNLGWLYHQEKSGGPILEQGIHLLDLARYLLDDEIVKVQAFGSNKIVPRSNECTIYDSINLNLSFASGIVGSHVHSWAHRGWTFEIRLYGEDFHLTLDIPRNRLFGVMNEVDVSFEGSDDPYQTELAGFVESLRTGNQGLLRSTYADATRTLAVCIAANKSLQTGAVEQVEA